ncbi:hypothetical protein TNCT_632741 [Trichonephila clavata]|uniref:Uncharacterized protein n=1 Tax=Trichonephila clavata TaxID=2740835 RepID=A0A8X6HUB2_TRICU|nr:hypothetical protein TNCT_632741 [Trichonephila clavata]
MSTIINTPTSNATTSFTDCQNLVSSNRSGITETVAMYIKPPAVKGNIKLVALSSMPSANKLQAVPATAPMAVTN